jgi:predicted dehydrogenase
VIVEKKQRLLIVGLGSIGERHLRCALASGRASVLACEVNHALRQAVADRYDLRETYADFDAALATRPTAAVLCVPAHLHVAMATRLAQAGVHVLIEKPLGTSLDGVDELQRVVKEQATVAAVAYVHRANPNLAAARQAIQSRRFGKPVQLIAVAGQHFPFYRPAYRDTYYRNRTSGGGAIQDALTHLINAGEWLIGPVERLLADAAHQVVPDVEVEDTVHVLARQHEIPACYTLNQHQAPNELTITVICETGTVRCEIHEQRWRWMTEPEGAWHDEPSAPLERDDLFLAQLQNFFDAIEHGRPPLCSLDEGVQTLRVNLAILRSLDETHWTTI